MPAAMPPQTTAVKGDAAIAIARGRVVVSGDRVSGPQLSVNGGEDFFCIVDSQMRGSSHRSSSSSALKQHGVGPLEPLAADERADGRGNAPAVFRRWYYRF